MQLESSKPVVRIAAAVIRDQHGRYLLVRKRGTTTFMQAGGKIEQGEEPLSALQRELSEELGLEIDDRRVRYLGQFEAEAANEPNHVVVADLFDLVIDDPLVPAAEIEEIVWLAPSATEFPPLAPLTRRHVLGLTDEPMPHSG